MSRLRDFFSKQPISFVNQLPEELKFALSDADSGKTSEKSSTSALALLVEGVSLSSVIVIPLECMQILRKIVSS